MPQTIKDGSTGQTAQVDDHGRLYTLANTINHLQHHSWYHKDAFSVSYDTTTAGTSETPVAFFKNIDTANEYEFYLLTISADANFTARMYYDAEYDSGGTAVTAYNLFRGSGNTIDQQLYAGGASDDLVLDTTNQVKFATVYGTANQITPINFDGALVLGKGQAAHMTIEAAAGTNVSVLVLTSYHKTGTVL